MPPENTNKYTKTVVAYANSQGGKLIFGVVDKTWEVVGIDEAHPVKIKELEMESQKTRWGSCSDRGNISLNCLLMRVPSYVRKYVIVHELAHRKIMSHSTEFWNIVAAEMPDYKKAIK